MQKIIYFEEKYLNTHKCTSLPCRRPTPYKRLTQQAKQKILLFVNVTFSPKMIRKIEDINVLLQKKYLLIMDLMSQLHETTFRNKVFLLRLPYLSSILKVIMELKLLI